MKYLHQSIWSLITCHKPTNKSIPGPWKSLHHDVIPLLFNISALSTLYTRRKCIVYHSQIPLFVVLLSKLFIIHAVSSRYADLRLRLRCLAWELLAVSLMWTEYLPWIFHALFSLTDCHEAASSICPSHCPLSVRVCEPERKWESMRAIPFVYTECV